MKVICAGMPKTGTKSLCTALRTLGYNVYDFEEQLWYLRKGLKKAMDEGCSADEYRRMFEGVDAVTDIPACFLWEELHRAFPDAKVILTTRRNEDEWCASALHQIKVIRSNFLVRLLLTLSPTGLRVQQYANSGVRYGLSLAPSGTLQKGHVNESAAKMRYNQHNLYVAATTPKDQFLHFNLKDGWEPLCKFLGKPIPQTPFPHRNKGGQIFDEIVNEGYLFQRIKREVLFVLCVLVCLLSYCLYLLYGKFL